MLVSLPDLFPLSAPYWPLGFWYEFDSFIRKLKLILNIVDHSDLKRIFLNLSTFSLLFLMKSSLKGPHLSFKHIWNHSTKYTLFETWLKLKHWFWREYSYLAKHHFHTFRIMLLIKRILSFLADLRAFFSKDISCQVFFFNFGSILREVYKIVKKKMYSDDNKDNRQWEVFLSQKAKFNSLDCLSLSPVKYFVFWVRIILMMIS